MTIWFWAWLVSTVCLIGMAITVENMSKLLREKHRLLAGVMVQLIVADTLIENMLERLEAKEDIVPGDEWKQ